MESPDTARPARSRPVHPTLSLAEYILAIQNRTADLLVGPPRWCTNCRTRDRKGLIIRYRHRLYCSSCIPREKPCAGCGRVFRLARYRVEKTQTGLRLDSYCPRCARERQRNRYHALKVKRPLESGRVCTECGTWKSAREFYRHSTSAGGLNPICKRCKDAHSVAYAGSRRGRTASLRGAQHYRQRRSARARSR